MLAILVAGAGYMRAEAGGGARGHGHGMMMDMHGSKSGHGEEAKDSHGMNEKAQAGDKAGKTIYTTMEALHANGGTPPGWRFRIPKGDPEEGRDVFAKMECYSCHNIDGEKFPKGDAVPANVGPDLTEMGSMQGDAEYFFESIVNPNRVIVKGPGYIKNGPSIMPNYSDSIGLQEALALVAYLESLKGGHRDGGDHAQMPARAEVHN